MHLSPSSSTSHMTSSTSNWERFLGMVGQVLKLKSSRTFEVLWLSHLNKENNSSASIFPSLNAGMTTRVTHVEAKMKYPLLSSLSKAFLSSASSFFLANRSCEKQNKMSIVTDSKLTEQCVSLTYASNLCHIVKRCKQQALRRGRGKRTSSSSDDYGGRWRAVSWSERTPEVMIVMNDLLAKC